MWAPRQNFVYLGLLAVGYHIFWYFPLKPVHIAYNLPAKHYRVDMWLLPPCVLISGWTLNRPSQILWLIPDFSSEVYWICDHDVQVTRSKNGTIYYFIIIHDSHVRGSTTMVNFYLGRVWMCPPPSTLFWQSGYAYEPIIVQHFHLLGSFDA
jgi:hypothetical protein